MQQRRAAVSRDTAETTIAVELTIDGKGECELRTGIRTFDHMLHQLGRHGLFDLKVSANGPDVHHVVEDTAICLARALNEALGDKQGIVRMAHAIVPMDDALSMVALDISGRGYARIDVAFSTDRIGDLPADMVRHFLETLAIEAKLNLHARTIYGLNDHHKAESLFKALARALDTATSIDRRAEGRVPSTKEVIER